MNTDEFRVTGKDVIDFICHYQNTLKDMRVTPTVEPGYLRKELPSVAPETPESFEDIMDDVNKKIMPGMTHWSHPRFAAYFPAGNSYPSLLGGMICDALGCIGFSWAASPACTELETIVLDWVAKAISLPKSFLALEKGSKGGGCIQGSASESILSVMLAARRNAIEVLSKAARDTDKVDEGVLLSRLMAYCSKEAHSCVEKNAMIAFVRLRILPTDENNSLRGDTLQKAIEEDIAAGFVPFFVSCTVGTTSVASFDNLEEIGRVCSHYPNVWMHVDGAYAGSSFMCPELRGPLKGIEYADSFNLNCNKWMLTHFDCSLMWVRDQHDFAKAMVVDPEYLKHPHEGSVIDYRHWGVPLSRRFRSLKLWFVLRMYGISGIQKYIRNHVRLAKYFEAHVKKDDRFEVTNSVDLGLVCFRLKGFREQDLKEVNELNKKLIANINESGKLHMVPSLVKEKYILRFCVTAPEATEEDMDIAWDVITSHANELVEAADKNSELVGISGALERKRRETLARKRSFFVRMVSDPKIYNPVITKSPFTAQQPQPHPETQESKVSQTTSTNNNSSWISWPLGYFFQRDNENGSSANDVTIRFRHLDTMVRLKSPVHGRRGSGSPSPERDNARPPSRLSPITCIKQNSNTKDSNN